MAYTLDETSEGDPIHHNMTEYVSTCLLGDFNSTCIDNNHGPAITAKLSNNSVPEPTKFPVESVVCFVHNITFNVDFTAPRSTQVIGSYNFNHYEFVYDEVCRALSRAIGTLLNGFTGIQSDSPNWLKGSGVSNLVTRTTRIMETTLIGLISTASGGRFGKTPVQDPDRDDKLLARNSTLAEIIEELSRNQNLSLFSSTRL